MKFLGRTGLKVSPVCFGTMSFGGDADAATSADLYKAVRDKGINFLDCADGYQNGEAERILGGLMAHERDDLIITTKVFSPMYPGPNAGGSSRRHITRALEASLKRLGTDRVEVYFLHHYDKSVPIDEMLRSMEDLVRSGKVLHLGVSNYAAWQIAKALGIQTLHGWSKIDVLQPMYNLVKRQAEVEILPLAAEEGLGVITYSPLGAGLLAGKYGPRSAPNAGRLVENGRYAKRYGQDWMHGVAGDFTSFAAGEGVHPATLAVAWVMGNATVTAPIIGARSVEQLTPALAALDYTLDRETHAAVTAISQTPAPATDRLEEAT